MKKLEGKVAVITGGATGMGFATAALFVQEGASVYIMGRRQSELNRAVEAIGRNVTAVQGDISHLADIHRLYEIIQQHHKQINIVFANAGVGAFSPFTEVTEEQLDRELNINVKGTFFTIQQALPLLPDGSSVLLNGSIATSLAWLGSVSIVPQRQRSGPLLGPGVLNYWIETSVSMSSLPERSIPPSSMQLGRQRKWRGSNNFWHREYQ